MNSLDPAVNPFASRRYGYATQTVAAADRMDAIGRMDASQLRLVLALPELQKTVRKAAERRLRKMEGGAS